MTTRPSRYYSLAAIANGGFERGPHPMYFLNKGQYITIRAVGGQSPHSPVILWKIFEISLSGWWSYHEPVVVVVPPNWFRAMECAWAPLWQHLILRL